MRRIVLISVISAVAVAGCATGHAGTERPSSESVRIVGSSGRNLRLSPSEGAKEIEVPASIDRVWKVLPQIYDSLGIEIDNLDEARRVIGHSGMKLHRQLGKTLLTKIIDCGSTQGFPSADSYEIQFSVFTHVTAGENATSKVATTITAVGRPMAFAGEYVKCSTKGALETTIVEAVKTRLPKAG